VGGLIWTDYSQPEALGILIDENPQLEWVQLPFAGVDAFSEALGKPVRFTSAKGAYAEPVAEHALALCLALGRAIPERVVAKSWGRKFAVSLYEANIVIVGGGGITEELMRQLKPFRCRVTVVRKRPTKSTDRVEVSQDQLDTVLPEADFVVLACALTDETYHLFNDTRLALMKPEAYLVNVARGPVIDPEALDRALRAGHIAGAGIDVTEPEPLPDGHYLWSTPNLIITPHTADTKPMVLRMFAKRILENVSAYQGKSDWVGLVDPGLGY
jgi:phosphoglycerate dehydrogenase-like enzyme